MNPRIECPNCRARFKISEARTEVFNEEESRLNKNVKRVYPHCPVCKIGLYIDGERKAAGILFFTVMALLITGLFISNPIFLLAVFIILAAQNHLAKPFIEVNCA